MAGLSQVIEEAIRYPGFSFVNVQSPCVTYGEEEGQVKAQKARMKTLQSLGHDPADQLRAIDLARSSGTELYTGVFYRNPEPAPTLDALVRERKEQLGKDALPRERILELFLQR